MRTIYGDSGPRRPKPHSPQATIHHSARPKWYSKEYLSSVWAKRPAKILALLAFVSIAAILIAVFAAGSESNPLSFTGAPTSGTNVGGDGKVRLNAATTVASMCGNAGAGVGVSGYQHVIWIIMENEDITDVMGTGSLKMPTFIKDAQSCGYANNYFAHGRPSLNNYLYLTSGQTLATDDHNPPPVYGVENIYHQVEASGKTWKHYASRMPSNCDKTNSPPPPSTTPYYVVHHEPAAYYTNIACSTNMVPLGAANAPLGTITPGALQTDINNNTLPTLSVIGPADDGGQKSPNGGPGGEVDPYYGDLFLSNWIPAITNSATYKLGKTAIFITWDEGDFTKNDQHVATEVIAPTVRAGTVSATKFTHASLLRTTEEMLGLTKIGDAATATSMMSDFNL